MKVKVNLTLEYITEYDDYDSGLTMKARHLESEEELLKYKAQRLQYNDIMCDYLAQDFNASHLEVKKVTIKRLKK